LEERSLLSTANGLTDYQLIAKNPIDRATYHSLSASSIAADGAAAVNYQWEHGSVSSWFIGEQRAGESLIIGGLLYHDSAAISAGFRMFDWGFAHQAADGSFAGSEDAFHGTAEFVQAVAHACLVVQQSPEAQTYAAQVAAYVPQLEKAAQWMVSGAVLKPGSAADAAYYDRYFLDADALGLTSLLVGDAKLQTQSETLMQTALARTWSTGLQPEAGDNDILSQGASLTYAERWAVYFQNDALMPQVAALIGQGLRSEWSQIEASGMLDTPGGVRKALEGHYRVQDINLVINAFAYWRTVTGVRQWEADAEAIVDALQVRRT
jgi:hypothetical protein